jgi:tRNA (guanine-N7-)-methyltransferase
VSAEDRLAEDRRPHREIVSFVRRGSRLSRSRQQAWDSLAERYVLVVPRGDRDTVPAPAPDARLDLPAVFGRRAPLVLEVGSGLGENVARAAATDPGRDHLAFEVYLPGIAQTLDRLGREGLPTNVRLLPLDAQHSLAVLLPERCLDEVRVFFPDPWHKSRHHKRRLVNPPFVDVLAPLVKPGGTLRLATDWAQYALHMRRVLDPDPRWANDFGEGPMPQGTPTDTVPDDMPTTGWAPRFEGRVLTSFENKARTAGRLSWDLAYHRTDLDGR